MKARFLKTNLEKFICDFNGGKQNQKNCKIYDKSLIVLQRVMKINGIQITKKIKSSNRQYIERNRNTNDK